MKNILVTGGAGYIGSHVVRELLKAGDDVTVVDDFSSGKRENLPQEVRVVEGNFGDRALLTDLFTRQPIDAVVHMAASIEVAESVLNPLPYLNNNVLQSMVLLEEMHSHGVGKLIFSSTAAVYGIQEKMPVSESAAPNPLDPYGFSKLLCERVIEYHTKFCGLSAVVFRYFNACGSDAEHPIRSAHESHLIPIVIDVATGRRKEVSVFGDDYQTIDGTGVRDYVHVSDIALAHVAGLGFAENHTGFSLFNIGTGRGHSVLEVVNEAARVTGKNIPTKILPRRVGDAPITVADNSKIKEILGFQLSHSDMENIIRTSMLAAGS